MIKPFFSPTCDSGGCSSSNPIESIVEGVPGPQGIKGPDGDKGVIGDTGAQGPDGVDGVAIFDYAPTGGSTNSTTYSQILSRMLDLTDFLDTIGNEVYITVRGSFSDVSNIAGVYSIKMWINSAELFELTTGSIKAYDTALNVRLVNLGSGNIQAFAEWMGKSTTTEPNLLMMKLNPASINAGLTAGVSYSLLLEGQVADANKTIYADNSTYINGKQ